MIFPFPKDKEKWNHCPTAQAIRNYAYTGKYIDPTAGLPRVCVQTQLSRSQVPVTWLQICPQGCKLGRA